MHACPCRQLTDKNAALPSRAVPSGPTGVGRVQAPFQGSLNVSPNLLCSRYRMGIDKVLSEEQKSIRNDRLWKYNRGLIVVSAMKCARSKFLVRAYLQSTVYPLGSSESQVNPDSHLALPIAYGVQESLRAEPKLRIRRCVESATRTC